MSAKARETPPAAAVDPPVVVGLRRAASPGGTTRSIVSSVPDAPGGDARPGLPHHRVVAVHERHRTDESGRGRGGDELRRRRRRSSRGASRRRRACRRRWRRAPARRAARSACRRARRRPPGRPAARRASRIRARHPSSPAAARDRLGRRGDDTDQPGTRSAGRPAVDGGHEAAAHHRDTGTGHGHAPKVAVRRGPRLGQRRSESPTVLTTSTEVRPRRPTRRRDHHVEHVVARARRRRARDARRGSPGQSTTPVPRPVRTDRSTGPLGLARRGRRSEQVARERVRVGDRPSCPRCRSTSTTAVRPSGESKLKTLWLDCAATRTARARRRASAPSTSNAVPARGRRPGSSAVGTALRRRRRRHGRRTEQLHERRDVVRADVEQRTARRRRTGTPGSGGRSSGPERLHDGLRRQRLADVTAGDGPAGGLHARRRAPCPARRRRAAPRLRLLEAAHGPALHGRRDRLLPPHVLAGGDGCGATSAWTAGMVRFTTISTSGWASTSATVPDSGDAVLLGLGRGALDVEVAEDDRHRRRGSSTRFSR